MIGRIVKMLVTAGLIAGIGLIVKVDVDKLGVTAEFAPSRTDVQNYAERMRMTRELMQNPDIGD